MTTAAQIAAHIRQFHFGNNWTTTHLKEVLSDVSIEQARLKHGSFNSLLALTFHINYYVETVLKVMQGKELDAHDKLSFNLPPINDENEWKRFQEKVWSDAEQLALLVETMPDKKLQESFTNEKYGTYFRNLAGIIEHGHYHLGQMVILKRLIQLN